MVQEWQAGERFGWQGKAVSGGVWCGAVRYGTAGKASYGGVGRGRQGQGSAGTVGRGEARWEIVWQDRYG